MSNIRFAKIENTNAEAFIVSAKTGYKLSEIFKWKDEYYLIPIDTSLCYSLSELQEIIEYMNK